MDPFDLQFWDGYSGPPAQIDAVAVHSEHVTGKSCLFVALKGKQHDGHAYLNKAASQGARYALVRENFVGNANLTLIHVPDPLTALQEIAAAYRKTLPTKVVGITGTYGKTMTKDLLAAFLSHIPSSASRESFNSQLGVALSLLAIRKTDQVALIEAGISRPNEMQRLANIIAPDAAILTSLDDAHLRTLNSRRELIKEKGVLLQAVPPSEWVLAPDNLWDLPHWLPSQAKTPHLPTVSPHPNRPLHFTLCFPSGETFEITLPSGFPAVGKVLTQAVRAAWLLNVSPSQIQTTLQTYQPEPMRTEVWTSPRGVTFINDCYGTDPLSIDRALAMLPPNSDSLFMTTGSIPNASLQRLGERGPVCHIGDANGPNITSFPTRQAALCHLRSEQKEGRTILLKGEQRQSLEDLRSEVADGLGDTRLAIHMDAIRHNLTTLAMRYQATIIPMIKANGYGMGAIPLARLFEACEVPLIGVAHVSEAIQLRLAGIQTGLFVFAPARHEVPQLVEWDLQPGVDSLEMIAALNKEATARGQIIQVHLHVNTGMTRFGCQPKEVPSLERAISNAPALELHGLFSHFGCADNPQKDRITLKQLRTFLGARDRLEKPPPFVHIANTAGTLRFGLASCTAIRVGLALLGLANDPALRPALTLTSRLATIHTCNKRDWVSYGASYRIKKNGTRIGVIPLGYFDGLRRSFSNKGHVLIHGQPAPIVGDICMDYAMVDLTRTSDAAVGDPVLVFGQDDAGFCLPTQQFAAQGNLSPYELITGLGSRVQRLYLYDGETRDLL